MQEPTEIGTEKDRQTANRKTNRQTYATEN